jgi:hypothetical protein
MIDRHHRPTVEEAETLAVEVLSFFAEDPETLGRFLSATGLGPETLREAAAAPGFFAAVLEHLMGDEALLLVFAERRRIRPTMIAAARHLLDPVTER